MAENGNGQNQTKYGNELVEEISHLPVQKYIAIICKNNRQIFFLTKTSGLFKYPK